MGGPLALTCGHLPSGPARAVPPPWRAGRRDPAVCGRRPAAGAGCVGRAVRGGLCGAAGAAPSPDRRRRAVSVLPPLPRLLGLRGAAEARHRGSPASHAAAAAERVASRRESGEEEEEKEE